MEVYISINGVLRNIIPKFEYHYQNNFIDAEIEVDENTIPFDYKITTPIRNDDLMKSFTFQSVDEFNNFLYIDYPLEIFGHSTLSYPTVIADLHTLIREHPDINFTLVSIDEFGKAKPSTLFFLSKCSFQGNNIKFILSKDIEKEWEKCDLWITDNWDILLKCPKNKIAIKFITDYNQYYSYRNEINNLKKIDLLCLKSWGKTIISMWITSLKNVVQYIHPKKVGRKK
jgi:hypothetical protein